MKEYQKLVALLSSEFNKYLIDHRDIAEKIPRNSLIIFKVDGASDFNSWSEEVSRKNSEKNQPIIFVNIKKWRQKASVEELDVVLN